MPIREPAVAGSFYPADQKALEAQMGEYLSAAKKKGIYNGVISPHAGYIYSGKTASQAIFGLKRFMSYVVLGPNHTGIGAKFSIMSSGKWTTPLGETKVDEQIAKDLLKLDFVADDYNAHRGEHSIEVQLPFLQRAFRVFTFVPVCIGGQSYSDDFVDKCLVLGRALARIVKNGPGIVASSDFSHYLKLDRAREIDYKAISMILKLNVTGFIKALASERASVCGFGPIAVLLECARASEWRPELIHSSHSGEVSGDSSSVVTYYSIGFRGA